METGKYSKAAVGMQHFGVTISFGHLIGMESLHPGESKEKWMKFYRRRNEWNSPVSDCFIWRKSIGP